MATSQQNEARGDTQSLRAPAKLAFKLAGLLGVMFVTGPEPEPSAQRLRYPSAKVRLLNESWRMEDELRRLDAIAGTLAPIGIASATASAAVAATLGHGKWSWLLGVGSVVLAIPTLLALLALSVPPYAQTESDMGPRLALRYKARMVRGAIASLFYVLLALVAVAGLLTHVR